MSYYRNILDNLKLSIDDNKFDDNLKKFIGILFFFNNYFYSILEDHVIKVKRRRKFNLMIANELYLFFTRYALPAFKNNEFLEDYNDLKLETEFWNHGLKDFKKIKSEMDSTPARVLLYKFYYNIFKLFNKATFHIYSGHVYGQIKDYCENLDLNDIKFEYKDGILLRLEFVKLFDKFFVFFPNHLLTKRHVYNRYQALMIGENMVPKNNGVITEFILDEFTFFEKFMELHAMKNKPFIDKIVKYLFKGLLCLIYKFLKGIQVHVTILTDENLIKDLNQDVDEIVDELEKRFPQFKKLFNQKNKNKTNLAIEASINKMLFSSREERVNPYLAQLKQKSFKGVSMIKKVYNNSSFSYIIERYIRKKDLQENTKFMKKYGFSNLIKAQFGENLSMKQQNSIDEYTKFLKPLKIRYKFIKEQAGYSSENSFLRILKDNRKLKRNLKTLIWHFVENMCRVDLSLESSDYNKQFLVNDYFIYSIIIMDNLIQWNDDVRQELYNILTGDKFKEKTKMMLDKLWSIFMLLYKIVFFKTFMDEFWEEYWSKFYIISNFFQNLCENNFVPFKKFLSDKTLAKGQFKNYTHEKTDRFSIFFELYIALETAANYTYFWLNTEGSILPSDTPEMYSFFKRLLIHVNEHLTGPYLGNIELIYRFRIDIWSGLITRIIDDIDSKFYEVKMACLQYISALLEGLNN